MNIRVVVADDQEMVRSGFAMILNAQADIEVVGEASDGAEAVELARRLQPDVVLADIRMPRLDGLEVTRLLADTMRVVVVTTFDLDEYVYAALRNGACGFLLKDAGPALLVEAVRAAVSGDTLISPSVTVRLLKHITKPSGRPPSLPESLTERETDVLRLVARGKTNADIAAELFIALGTVKTHVASLQRKLDVRNRTAVAAWAWENGLVA
ncbi:response regulator [Fodinicola acaciae]|uniref:response regulator n=1 Tax=Fodinicola acaciae TaxID=2681555 RepID=UPI0013D0FD72|nr:response regulator transcription factor [Fodinicola acaciae]